MMLMQDLRKNRRLDFDLPLSESDPALSTDVLYNGDRGKMMGMLVCRDTSGREIVHKAFSSKYNGRYSVSGWAEPLVDTARYVSAIEAGNKFIHPLTVKINLAEPDSDTWKNTFSERKVVSRRVLSELNELYEIRNFRRETRSLAGAFNHIRGIPTGAGDCCTPKLLNHAAKNNLIPLSIAEFFWGEETLSGQRREGMFYEACKDKCQPLLGFMLCGISEMNTAE